MEYILHRDLTLSSEKQLSSSFLTALKEEFGSKQLKLIMKSATTLQTGLIFNYTNRGLVTPVFPHLKQFACFPSPQAVCLFLLTMTILYSREGK